MIMLTVITPCMRISNLPFILSKLEELGTKIEWVVIYDKNKVDKVDEKILIYPAYNTKIKLLISDNDPSTGNAWKLRNIGMDNASGDYLYFLDDDNIPSKSLYYGVKNYMFKYDLIVFNQVRRGKELLANYHKNLDNIDTAQFIVRNGLKSRWEPSSSYREERAYFSSLLNEVLEDKVVYLPVVLSYYNYLGR